MGECVCVGGGGGGEWREEQGVKTEGVWRCVVTAQSDLEGG